MAAAAGAASATAASRDIEEGPRSALLVWGGGMLIAGLSLVGAGAGAEGAPLALAGLLNTIYGIHTFGRLGPEDLGAPGESSGESSASARATSMIWTGVLTALAGGILAVDHALGKGGVGPWVVTTYGLVLLGLARVRQGRRALAGGAKPDNARRAKARVEKRRRLDKSPAP
jgi:hypothetical protein